MTPAEIEKLLDQADRGLAEMFPWQDPTHQRSAEIITAMRGLLGLMKLQEQITGYAIAREWEYDKFMEKCQEHLNAGMVPQGGISCWEHTWFNIEGDRSEGTGYAQAFIKKGGA